jgi:CheY-like chemotaxis protein
LLQVLLDEDDLVDMALMESSLAERRVATELHHVADGPEAQAFLRLAGGYADMPPPDPILLDLTMPRADSRQVPSTIKTEGHISRRSRWRSPPPRHRPTSSPATARTPMRT